MSPRDPNELIPDPNPEDIDLDPDLPDPDFEGPELEEPDWDDLEGAEIAPDSIPENGDFRYEEDEDAIEPLGEDDDNPYQNSDEALPDDDEEAAIRRDLSAPD